MRILLNEDGYLDQWVLDETKCQMSDSDIVVDTPENLDIKTFYKEFHLYHLEDGKLVKDKDRERELMLNKRKTTLTIEEKIRLFVEAIPVEEYPEHKDGVDWEPFYDVESNKFTWKESSATKENR